MAIITFLANDSLLKIVSSKIKSYEKELRNKECITFILYLFSDLMKVYSYQLTSVLFANYITLDNEFLKCVHTRQKFTKKDILFCLSSCFTSTLNSRCHVGMVSYPNNTFSRQEVPEPIRKPSANSAKYHRIGRGARDPARAATSYHC